MDKREKLIAEIIKESKADGEELTREEAEKIADMEIKAKANRNYVQGDKKKEKKPRERKVDDDKKILIDIMKECFEEYEDITVTSVKNEASIDLTYYDNEYTVKLIKHRPPKEK